MWEEPFQKWVAPSGIQLDKKGVAEGSLFAFFDSALPLTTSYPVAEDDSSAYVKSIISRLPFLTKDQWPPGIFRAGFWRQSGTAVAPATQVEQLPCWFHGLSSVRQPS